ncbi:MAG: methionyl-tRNA formyltransferase [Acidimicrobiia bacterium]|nr:methionyl-tRNA formyltransferase [Acidimicrobiia bacterium]MYC57362.1 methionyl-tRNA formyltransferase [Acidimicrobiia bacterium]MYG94565.1 methionyl-tRNA formyltransferase [Acidimicrobiia bacterium]MYI31152.1 methionyl-tRNA formyltransferase [Acidimicrobiia bacterium]
MIRPPGDLHRLVFFGTPLEAVPFLDALCVAGFEVAFVVTGGDKRRGRRAAPSPSPVKVSAQALDIPVSHDVSDALQVKADLGVVVAFGQIIQSQVLDRLAMVNVHFSLLPRWRGAAPVERAILAGDAVAGVCLMEVAEGLDTGGVYRSLQVPIATQATTASLTVQLVQHAVPMLVQALQQGLGKPTPQQGEPCYAKKITKEDLHLQWHQPVQVLHRQVRVGGAWTTRRNKILKVWQAEPVADQASVLSPLKTLDQRYVPGQVHPHSEVADLMVRAGDGWLRLVEVQVEGGVRQSAQEWLRGARLQDAELLG